MKLLNLYIENFGGLHHFALDFEEGITSVIQPNGFGKTTLAEFIRAMFYGFPRKSKTLEKSLRQKYTPWGGGNFGGNLSFEYEKKRYRIERTFGANPKGDTFALIDLETNRKSGDFSEELGQELFGLDAESFERSVYLPQLRDAGSFATASIQAKLSDLVEDSSDVANFDKAMASLKARRSALIPYRGSGGTVAETVSEITSLQLRLDALQSQEKQLQDVQEEAAQAQQKTERTEELLAQTCEELQRASQQEADILRRRQYLQLQNRHSREMERISFYERKYPKGLPQEDALHRAELAAERLKRSGKREQIPTEEQLDDCRRCYRAYADLQAQLQDMQLRRAELERAERRKAKAGAAGQIVAILLAVAAFAAGGVMIFLLEMIYGAALMAIGALALCVLIGRKCLRKRAAARKQADLQQKIHEMNTMAEKYRRELTAFFEAFGLHVQPQSYRAALEELERRSLHGMQQNREVLAAHEELRLFFEGLGLPVPLKMDMELQQLREDLRMVQAAKILQQELSDQLAAMEESDGEILFVEFASVRDSRQLRQEEQQLRMELTAATSHMLQTRQKLQRLQVEIAQLPDVKEALKQAQQRLREEQEQVKILDATMDFLQQARVNLTTAYMGTIRSRFGFYLSVLGGSNERFLIDVDLQVKLERQGQVRELAYFSAGQSDLVLLCMRLALADALFGTQEIFLILDDPFVNLDDTHIRQARCLLQKLAAGRQILYLTCHSSRVM